MSDVPTIADAEELTVVNQLVERQRERLIEETNDQLEQYTRQAIAEVNWSTAEVLDIIHKTWREPDSLRRHHGFQYHAYKSAALAPATETYYGVGDHHKQVYRLTEYACREIGIDPETGEDVE